MLPTFGGCCIPDTKGKSRASVKAEKQMPKKRGRNLSYAGSKYSGYAPRLSITSNSAPIKFYPPKRFDIVENSDDPELSTSLMILEDRELTVDKKESPESPEPGLAKERSSVIMTETDFSISKLRLHDLSSVRSPEENKDEPRNVHRHAQSVDMTRGPENKIHFRMKSATRRARSKSSFMRDRGTLRRAKTTLGRTRSSSNTPRSGKIQKEFRIGKNCFSAKTFVERKITC